MSYVSVSLNIHSQINQMTRSREERMYGMMGQHNKRIINHHVVCLSGNSMPSRIYILSSPSNVEKKSCIIARRSLSVAFPMPNPLCRHTWVQDRMENRHVRREMLHFYERWLIWVARERARVSPGKTQTAKLCSKHSWDRSRRWIWFIIRIINFFYYIRSSEHTKWDLLVSSSRPPVTAEGWKMTEMSEAALHRRSSLIKLSIEKRCMKINIIFYMPSDSCLI